MRVKDNQPRLRDALVALCAERDPVDRHETADRGRHGRQEHRRVEVFEVGGPPRPGLAAVDGTVKLSAKGTGKRRSSLELRTYAAALAPVISAQIANACARTAR